MSESINKGYALLVGLTHIDKSKHHGWDGISGCWGCEIDVDIISKIVTPLGYSITSLKTEEATADKILSHLNEFSRTLKNGDILVFYFSGHGSQQPDRNGDELDGHDETLVVYDRELIDDQLHEIWLSFDEGVRIFMISDSCNSGTNYKGRGVDIAKSTPIDPIDKDVALGMKAEMIHFGGCKDGNESGGGFDGSKFTKALTNAWETNPVTDYPAFLKLIASILTDQLPQYNEYGQVNREFRNQKPFTI